MSGVFCGLEQDSGIQCLADVERTYGPAGSLWCPVHGHVVDVFPSPPLEGVAFLDFTDGTSAVVNLAGLR